MKLLVFSDSHGAVRPMLRAVRDRAPDAVAHLGDCVRDADALRRAFPELRLVSVRGNCDWAADAPDSERFALGGVEIFACHGHRYGVKTGLGALCNAGYFSGARLVLFGHTHVPLRREEGGLFLLNPGSAGYGCAELELADGEIRRAELLTFGSI